MGRLLVSVRGLNEVLAAAQGGARIIDVEYSGTVLGTPYPLNIKAVRERLDEESFKHLPISTNIGEEQRIRSTACQAAIGVALAGADYIKYGFAGLDLKTALYLGRNLVRTVREWHLATYVIRRARPTGTTNARRLRPSCSAPVPLGVMLHSLTAKSPVACRDDLLAYGARRTASRTAECTGSTPRSFAAPLCHGWNNSERFILDEHSYCSRRLRRPPVAEQWHTGESNSATPPRMGHPARIKT